MKEYHKLQRVSLVDVSRPEYLFNLIVFPVSADCIMAKNGNTLSYDGMERVHYVSALTFPKAKIEILEVYR